MDSPFITLLKRLQQPQKASNNTSVVCCAASALSIFLPESGIFEGHDMFEHFQSQRYLAVLCRKPPTDIWRDVTAITKARKKSGTTVIPCLK